jgi:hypothetical protein
MSLLVSIVIAIAMALLVSVHEAINRQYTLTFILGRAIAQAVSLWLPTAAARVQTRV